MIKSIKILVLGSTVALAVIAWTLRYVPDAFAHDGHKHSNAPASAKKVKNPLMANDANIGAGRALFSRNCAVCHGEDGKAQTQMAQKMKVKPTDLTAKEMHGITDGEINWVVTNGIKTKGMPDFKNKMKDNERWQVTLYVKHLMGAHPRGEGSKH